MLRRIGRLIDPATLHWLLALAAGAGVVVLGHRANSGGVVVGAIVCTLLILSADWLAEQHNVMAEYAVDHAWRPSPAWLLAALGWLALIALGVTVVVA